MPEEQTPTCHAAADHQRRARARLAALVAAVLAVSSFAACGGHQTLRESLSFHYRGRAPSGLIDQILTIRNSGPDAAVPTLRFEPVDRSGRVVRGVTVNTAFGSDQGLVVVPPGGAVDVLAFHGAAKSRVDDVRVRIRRIEKSAMHRPEALVTVQPLDEAGNPVAKFGHFTSIEIGSANSHPVTVRVVALTYDEPSGGAPQQITSVLRLAGPLRVPARGATIAKLAPRVATRTGNAGSIKAYFSQ